MRLRAQQSCPALPKEPETEAPAFSRSASAKIRLADLPPSSRATRLTSAAAVRITSLPTSVEPVKEILRTSGCRARAEPAAPPGPGTTLSTPGGKPASAASSARSRAESGVADAGLTTIELPTASAGATFQVVMAKGKFHGTMRPQTPTGSRKVRPVPGAETGTVRPPKAGIRPA
jgi:hypothetical protein